MHGHVQLECSTINIGICRIPCGGTGRNTQGCQANSLGSRTCRWPFLDQSTLHTDWREYISIYIFTYISLCGCIHIYIYIERERGFRSLPLRNPTWHASVKKASVGTHTRRVFLIYTYSRGILSWPWRNGWQQGC